MNHQPKSGSVLVFVFMLCALALVLYLALAGFVMLGGVKAIR